MANDYSKLSKEELLKVIEKLESRKKYGLIWDAERTKEQFEKESENALPVLKEVKGKEIKTDPSKPVNILIEGDNYHALSVLNYTHQSKIDVIYIDPPYNTENKDFKYNDCWIDKKDTYRHSKWLSFMSKRLRLSKSLLKEHGAVFISINEEELAQLKILCDKIFGEDNYLTTFTIKVRHEDRILKGDKDFHEVVEYLLLYRRSEDFKPLKRSKDNTSIEEYVYEVKELADSPKTIKFGSKKVDVFTPDQYEITKGNPSEDKFKKINIRGSIKEGNSSGRFYMKHIEPAYKDKKAYLLKVHDMGADRFDHRYFLTPTSKKKRNGDYFQGVPVNRADIKEYPFPNFFDFEEDFNNVGYEGGVDFRNGKKPIVFLQKIFEISRLIEKSNAIVLDFFAGSGSTGHALLDFNVQHGGSRQIILCTNNEVDEKTDKNLRAKGLRPGEVDYEKEGICQKVTYPRMKNAIKGYTNGRGAKVEGIDSNLKHFNTSFVKRSISKDSLKIRITRECTEMLCLREGIFNKVKKTNDYRIFQYNNRIMGVYYSLERGKLKLLKKDLDKMKGKKILYCFTLDPLGLDKKDFRDWKGVSLEPIPQKILDIYEDIYEY